MTVRQSLIPALLLFSLAAGADVESHRAAATAAIQAADLPQAVTHLSALLEEAPEDGSAHYRLGSVLMDLDKPEAAITHFRQARTLQFQPQGAGYRLARIHGRAGRLEEALTEIESIAAAGFSAPQLIERETDLVQLTGEARYQAALAAIRNNRYPCENNPGAHAFDFWVGEWDVTQGGAAAGTNRIEAILGHCVLFEHWTSLTGGQGKSFNFYDPGYDRWRQIWISDSGSFIEFHGAARDGGIFYTAETRNPQDGSITMHRLEFTPNPDGSVRQHWQQSTDQGQSWASVWDAIYTRRSRMTGAAL